MRPLTLRATDALSDCGRSCAVSQELSDEISEALERARVVGVLDAWADSHETDGTVELVRAMGDGASWGLKLSRASNRSDPSELSVNDISYYDEDGNRCWFFEAETADATRAAAAKAIEAGEV